MKYLVKQKWAPAWLVLKGEKRQEVWVNKPSHAGFFTSREQAERAITLLNPPKDSYVIEEV